MFNLDVTVTGFESWFCEQNCLQLKFVSHPVVTSTSKFAAQEIAYIKLQHIALKKLLTKSSAHLKAYMDLKQLLPDFLDWV